MAQDRTEQELRQLFKGRAATEKASVAIKSIHRPYEMGGAVRI